MASQKPSFFAKSLSAIAVFFTAVGLVLVAFLFIGNYAEGEDISAAGNTGKTYVLPTLNSNTQINSGQDNTLIDEPLQNNATDEQVIAYEFPQTAVTSDGFLDRKEATEDDKDEDDDDEENNNNNNNNNDNNNDKAQNASACNDSIMNGDETGVDCGGLCNSCVEYLSCAGSANRSCEIPNANGIQFRTCVNQNWTEFSKCVLASCKDGYVLSGNDCIPIVPDDSNSDNADGDSGTDNDNSDSDSDSGSSCTIYAERNCTIANGKGTQYKACFNGTYVSSYGPCYVVSCNEGYVQSGQTCIAIPDAKTCEGSPSQACTIANGTGNLNRTCTNGIWSEFGSCELVSCNAGYSPSGNECIQKTCTGSAVQSCTLENGKGMKRRECVDGTWTDFGPCTTETCDDGSIPGINGCAENIADAARAPRSSRDAIIADHYASADFSNMNFKCIRFN